MNANLRPSTLGEILDRTAQLYRRNFWLFAGVAALPIGVIIAISALAVGLIFAIPGLRGGPPSPTVAAATRGLLLLVMFPIYLAAAVFSYAGLTEAAGCAYRGEKLTIRAALASVRPWFWRYLWYMVLQSIVVVLVPSAIAAAVTVPLIYLASQAGEGVATGAAIGFVVFLVIAAAIGVIVWLALSYSMGMAACVVEQRPAWESLKRSWKLSQGTRGRIFVMYLLVIALVFAVSMVAAIPFLIIVAVISSQGNGAEYATTAIVVARITRVVVDFILQVLLTPISWIALVLFYYDQRIRKEGFDIEWMMAQAGMTQLAPAAPPARNAGISGVTSISAPPAPPDTVEEP